MAGKSFPDSVALVVAEPTPIALWQALEQAAQRARVVEIRLDALGSAAAIVSFLDRLSRRRRNWQTTFIATCRGRAQGGGFAGTPAAQLALLALAARAGCQWVDLEASSLESMHPGLRRAVLPPARVIVSHHDFRRTPPARDLRRLFKRMSRLGGDLVKIAATARRQSDNAALLALTRQSRRRLIAVSMGPTGVPGRVLALRAGSPLTYAAPDGSARTAPGQLGWTELRQRYRAHELSSRTRVYGVMGRPIAHSLSPAMHNAAFRAARLDAVYLPLEVSDVRDFLGSLGALGIAGFSVTIPHKQAILRYLDGVDPLAEMIGAVNTVVVRGGGQLYGYNTDYVGVLRTLQRYVRLEGSPVLVLGAGGAARAVAFALATAGAFISVSSRRPAAARALAKAVGGEAVNRRVRRGRRFAAIINCTPVGQAPAVAESPLRVTELNAKVLFDLVYNPRETALLRMARRRGLQVIPGWQMLVEQGAAQFEIWTGLRAPLEAMRRAVLESLQHTKP